MLLEKRKNLTEQAHALLERAASENRDLTGEEQATFDKIGLDITNLRAHVDRQVQMAADEEALQESMRGFQAPAEQLDGDARTDHEVRSFLRGEKRELALYGPNGKPYTMAETRALSKGTATAGGNTVPTSFYGRLLEHMILTASLLRANATILNTTSGETIQIPVTTAHGGAALVAEAGTIAQSDPAFGQRSLGAYKYGVLIRVPRELIDDTAVDLLGYLARQAGRAVGNVFGTDLITGNGTGKPLGITASTTLGVTGGTGVAGVPTFDNLIDLYYSVIAPYRNSPDAAWLINDTTAGALRKLKDSSGRYLWEPSLIPGTPDTILGKPVYTDPNMAATGVNNKSVVFGDLSAYFVRLVNGIRFERSDEFAFDTDTTVFRCLIRGDGVLTDLTGAVKHYVGAAT
jgi:HK97 family phage major capsid protein